MVLTETDAKAEADAMKQLEELAKTLPKRNKKKSGEG